MCKKTRRRISFLIKHKLRLFEFLVAYNSVVMENGGALVAIFAPQVICGADTMLLYAPRNSNSLRYSSDCS